MSAVWPMPLCISFTVAAHSTASNQQLAVSTGTIATYFANLAPPCGCLHAVVNELCISAPIGAIVI